MAQEDAEAGRGYQREYWVGAYYLAAMLGGGVPDGDVGRVRRVQFQGGALGDVVVQGTARGDARLVLQAKTTLPVSGGHSEFAKVVRQMHQDSREGRSRLGTDRYGVAVRRMTAPLHDLEEMAERAAANDTAKAFWGAIEKVNAGERRVLDAVVAVLRATDGVEGAENEAWELLRSGVVVLGLTPDRAGGRRPRPDA